MMAPPKASNGPTAKITNVNFQPKTKPMTIPVIAVLNHWKKLPILSPIPDKILLTSSASRVLSSPIS